jgi:uncharacterized protein (DUF1330 family)
MANGYWIASVDVTNMEEYQKYVQANAAPFSEFGGRFIIRGGASETREVRFAGILARQDISRECVRLRYRHHRRL